MKIGITSAISLLFITFISIVMINVMSVNMQISKLQDFHYGMVNEIESSDFSPAVIEQHLHNKKYNVQIENRSAKDDLRIYQIKTSGKIQMPIFGFIQMYTKESTAR